VRCLSPDAYDALSLLLIRHMLKIIDNGEFYEQEKPLSLKDLKSLVLILKQV
jgi:hypothetical protein